MSAIEATEARLVSQVVRLTSQLAECESRVDDVLEAILLEAPEEWDGDEAADWIAVNYVRKLEAAARQAYGRLPGPFDFPGEGDEP